MSFISSLEDKFLRIQFTGRDRLRLYRKLSRFLANGVGLPNALDAMWKHASQDGRKPKTVQAIVIDSWRRKVNNGQSFGTAIQDWVPQSDRVVIEAGEKAGNLSESLENACLLNEGQGQIKSAVIGGVAYPLVLVAMAIGFMVMFGLNVIPSFEEVLPRDRWTGIGEQMAGMSDFVKTGLIPSLGAVIAFFLLVFWSMPRWTGKLRVKVDGFPPYSIYRLIIGSGFLLSFAALTRAGVQETRVLTILQRNASPWYAERLSRSLALVQNGRNIGEALHLSGYNFPDKDTVNDLRAYAALSGFGEMLLILGKQNLDDSVTKIKGQSVVLRNAGIIVLGIVFMWIAMGIFDLISQIQAATT